MNLFLLGNGFDLHHSFPTTYINFLNTTRFLIGNYNDSIKTIGDVFGKEELQLIDPRIKECYQKHLSIYNDIVLDKEKIQSLIDNAIKNKWFKYFSNCFNKDIGWIDFEKEIALVIDAFDNFFEKYLDGFHVENGKLAFDLDDYPQNTIDNYIIKQFDFFYEKASDKMGLFGSNLVYIKPEYAIEYPLGAKNYRMHTEKIASQLFLEMQQLSLILKEYIKLFIDVPANEMKKSGKTPRCVSYPKAQHVFTFNYTNTHELFYGDSSVHHIHGEIKSNIILGVNPDEFDYIGAIDTTFIMFKKYYQRIFYKMDYSYIKKIQGLKRTRNADGGYTLYVIGHSLDKTDQDVIKELFEVSRKIIIFYHNEAIVGTYIKNLIEIYGKNDFDELRVSKMLEFLPQGEIEWV